MSELNATALHEALLQAGYTTEIEKLEIGNALNATIFYALWMGIYTVIYAGAIYVYFARALSRQYVVPMAVTLLYRCNLALFALQWDSTKLQFIDDGDSRDSVFLFLLFGTPVQIFIGLNVLTNIILVLADGLLIWRCFHVWNRSLRIISIPVLFVVTETALLLTQIIGGAISYELPRAATFNKISSAGIIMTACTTIVTTSLIAYRISSFLKSQEISSRKFRHIIDIVVQSGAVCSLSVLTLGISAAAGYTNLRIFEFKLWTTVIVPPLSGISATLMVARVAILTDDTNPASSAHLTGLQFRQRTTTRTSTGAQFTVDIAAHDSNTASAEAGEAEEIQGEKGDQSV